MRRLGLKIKMIQIIQNNQVNQYKANKLDEFLGIIFFCFLCLTVVFYNAIEAMFVVLAVISAIRYRSLLSFLRYNDTLRLFSGLLVLYSSFFLFRSLWGEYSHLSFNINFFVNNVFALFAGVLVAKFPIEGIQKNNLGFSLLVFIFLFGAFWFISFYLFALESSFMRPHGRLQFFQGKSPFGPAFIFWGLVLWYLSGLASSGRLRLKAMLVLIFLAIIYVNLFVNSRGASLGLIFSLIYLTLSFDGAWRRSIFIVSGSAFMMNFLCAYFISVTDMDNLRSIFMVYNFSDQKSALATYIFVSLLFIMFNMLFKRNAVFIVVVSGIFLTIFICLLMPEVVLKYIEPYSNFDGRLALWAAAISQFHDLPIFGYGRNYEFEVVTLDQPFVHNQYLSWVLEGGVLALVFSFIFIFGVFLKYFNNRNDEIAPFYGAFLLMWAVVIFFDGFFSMRGYLNIFIMHNVLFLSIPAWDDPALSRDL